MKIDAAKLESRVQTYLSGLPRGPGLFRKDARAQFLRASVELGTVGRVEGLCNLSKLSGVKAETVANLAITGHRLIRWLEEAGIAEVSRVPNYVYDLGVTLDNNKYVIELHPDLILER